MSANLVQDWLQIAAGLCGMFGLIFLATGIVDDKKDTVIIAPFIMAIGAAASSIVVLFTALSSMTTPTSPLPAWSWPGFAVLVLLMTMFGYLFGWSVAVDLPGPRSPLQLRRSRLFIAGGALGVIVFVLLGYVLVWWYQIPHIGKLESLVMLSLAGGFSLAVALLSIMAIRQINARGLRLIGLSLSLISISMLLIPSIADVLGTPIR
jgi:hypothetical protein